MPSSKTLLENCRQSIRALDAAGAAMEHELAKPKPLLGLHPLAQRLAQRHDPNEEIEMDTGYLRCSCCNMLTPIACKCERPLYVKAGAKFLARKGFEARAKATGMQREMPGKRRERGRPRSGKAPLTSTERSRRHRAKHR